MTVVVAGAARRYDPRVATEPEVRAVAVAHDLSLVVLYGSRARGTARAASDVDIGVLRADGKRLSYRALAALFSDLVPLYGDALDVADLATDDAIFRREVARDGRVLFQAPPDRWVDFVGQALIDYADIAPFVDACVASVARAARGEAVVGEVR